MFFLKRSCLYVTRKLSKSITLGIIFFVVASLVLTGFLIQSAANKTYNSARIKLGANVSYTTDLSSIMDVQRSQGGNRQGQAVRLEIPDDFFQITTKELEKIASNSKYVKSYTYGISLGVNPFDFDYYEDENSNRFQGGMIAIGGINNRPLTMTNMTISGVHNISQEASFNDGTNNIIDGRYFNEEEINNSENKIIIEQTIASINSLVVGDKIKVIKVIRDNQMNEVEVEIEYEIIGIYRTSNPTSNASGSIRFGGMGMTENTMYAPYTTVLIDQYLTGLLDEERIVKESEYNEKGYEILNAVFHLYDPLDIDAFFEEVENMNEIDLTYRSLNANETAYKKMIGSIENVSKTSGVLVGVVVVAGIFILGLISILSVKERKYELGVLLSLGEERGKIICQLISEMLIVAVVAFSLAIGTSSLIAQGVTNYLLNQEVNSVVEEEPNRRPSFNIITVMPPELDVETIETLNVEVNAQDVIKLIGVGFLVIVLTNGLQGLFVLKYNPKEILLDR